METEAQQIIDILVAVASDGRAAERRQTLGPNSTLDGDLGIGSLERVELRIRLEKAFGVQLGDQEFLAARNVSDLVALVRRSGTAEVAPLGARPVEDGRQRSLEGARAARSLDEILTLQAAATPDAHAITFLREGRPERTMTYATLRDAALRMAGGLKASGVEPGERVGLMLPTGLPFVAGFFGTLYCGAVPVPMYPPVRPDQIQAFVERQSGILDSAGVRLLLSFPRARSVDSWLRARAPALREVVPAEDLLGSEPLSEPAEPSSDRIGFIQYTSGSTGTPRGVVLTHGNLLANLRSFGTALPLLAGDVIVSWLPLYHDMGLIGMLLAPLFYGVPLVLMGPEDFLLRPSRWLRAFHEYGGSVAAAPNFAFEICARKIPDAEIRGVDLSRWRVAINGAEPVRRETLERFNERFAPYGFRPGSIRPAYGLAENTLAVSMSLVAERPRIDLVSREALDREGWAGPAVEGEVGSEFVSAGRPVTGVEVRVVDEQGKPLTERWRGRIQFRGTSAFQGYFQNEAATQEVVAKDGWIDSGDLGYQADGELFPTGRRKALIIKAGRNLHAEDIERSVWTVPGIRSGCVAAFGIGDGQEGTDRLVVVAESRLTKPEEQTRMADEIRQRVVDAVGVPPDDIRIVRPGSVPKTPSGKIRRSACREALEQGTLGRRVGVVGQILKLVGDRPGWWLGQVPRLAYGVWAGFCIVVSAGVMTVAGVLGATAVPGIVSRWLLRLVGMRLSVSGGVSRSRGPALIVANHCSAMDPVVVMASWPGPVRFVAAAWIFDHPLLRPVLQGLQGVRIRRGGGGETAQQEVSQMQQALRDGTCLVVFAEGGLERSPGLRPFMMGPFLAAARERVAIYPIALKGTRHAMRWGHLIPVPGPVEVTIGAPLTPTADTWEAVTETARLAREQIAAHCGEPLVHRRLVRED